MSAAFIIGVLVIAALWIVAVRRSAGLIGIGVVVAAALLVFGGGAGPADEGADIISDVSSVVSRIGETAR